MDYKRYWVDEKAGKIFCLVDAPDAETAARVHREAHGLVLDVFVDAVRAESPGFDVLEPWRRTDDPDKVRAIMTKPGVGACEIHSEVDTIPVEPDDWWRIVMGTGLRSKATALDPDVAERLRRRCEQFMRENDVRQVELASRHIIAVKQ